MKTHDPVQLPYVQKLNSLVDNLPLGRKNFAQSLVSGYRQYKRLTHNQMEWVHKLIAEAEKPRENKAHLFEMPGFSVIEDLLYRAKKAVKWPCIRLAYGKIAIELRPKERTRGVSVRYDRKKIGYFSYEKFFANPQYEPNYPGLVFSLQELINDPVGTAARYGKETQCCSFCGIGLTDERSRLVGYGPICADNYGLPWGDRPGKVVSAKTVEELEKLL